MSKKAILLFCVVCLLVATALVPDVDYDDPRMAEIVREVRRSVTTAVGY